MAPITCDACRQPAADHDVVNDGSMEAGYQRLCGRCFNGAAASRLGLQVNDGLVLRGTVDSDPEEDHRVPMVVVDGRELSWNELGRMVATFEGWQFKLEFRNRSDEV